MQEDYDLYLGVRKEIEFVLALQWDVDFTDQDDLFGFGLDSLAIVILGCRLRDVFFVEIPLIAFFNKPTVENLVELVKLHSVK